MNFACLFEHSLKLFACWCMFLHTAFSVWTSVLRLCVFTPPRTELLTVDFWGNPHSSPSSVHACGVKSVYYQCDVDSLESMFKLYVKKERCSVQEWYRNIGVIWNVTQRSHKINICFLDSYFMCFIFTCNTYIVIFFRMWSWCMRNSTYILFAHAHM